MNLRSKIYHLRSYIICLVVLVGLLLRLPLLNGSFWLDEAAQALESTRPLSQQFEIKSDFQPPLFHLTVHFISLVSHADWWLRLASLVPGLISIYLLYQIGCQLFSRRVGLLASLFLATSQFHIFYSQELRPYSFASMFALLSVYFFIKLLHHSLNPVYYVLFTTLGMYSVYTFPFLILAQFLYVIVFHRSLLKSLIYHLASVILLCLPWLPSFLGQFTTGMGITESLPLWKTAVSPVPVKALLLMAPKFIFGRLDLPNETWQLIPLGLILLGVGYLILVKRPKDISPWLYFWALIPVIFGFFVSFKVPLLEPKRFLFCLPAIYLLIASLSSKWKYSLLLLNLITVVIYWFTPQFQREPWREAIDKINRLQTATSVVVFPWDAPYAPWVWYSRFQGPTLSFSPLPVTKDSVALSFSNLDPSQTLIYFDYLESVTDPEHLIRQTLAQSDWKESGYLVYPNIGKIRQFNR